ncbi:MAG: hypothetical protein HZB13_04900 [Acidobacteria bacterium]|nr:hypothetical protein [Acidobacteriota bacterium]
MEYQVRLNVRIARLFLVALAVRAQTPAPAGRVWPSEPPADCPFPNSTAITGLRFTGRQIKYTTADTWYPSWGADGRLYSPWTDGTADGLKAVSIGPKATTGWAVIEGDDPMQLKITSRGAVAAAPEPYGGRYPSASLHHKGIWYYGTYCLMDSDGNPGTGLNWDILGPFVGFRTSIDNGKTWIETPHTPSQPLFPEPVSPGGKVKFGAPHFVDFGRDMRNSPGGYAYLVAHGARDPDPSPRPANASWITGDQIYLARVKPSLRTINDRRKWQFFAGRDSRGRARWTHQFDRIQPLVDWNNRCGNVSITYNAPLAKYLMVVTDGGNTISKFDTWILESASITGPWRMVTFMKRFGEQAYFVNFPSKFISLDGRTAWLCYAANFSNGNANFKEKHLSNPPGSGYGMCLHEVELLK